MPRVLRSIVLAALLLAAVPARADEVLKVEVGKATRWSPGHALVMTVCDDLSIVSVEAAGDALMLTGKKPGKTQCAFYRTPGEKRLVTVEVVEPEAKPGGAGK